MGNTGITDEELDFLTTDAIAYLYGKENGELAEKEFDRLVNNARNKLEDEAFLRRIERLKPKGQVTVSILLQSMPNGLRYIYRLRLTIRKSVSRHMERYSLDVGAAFVSYVQDYPFHFEELWLRKRACGSLDAIKRCINDPAFMNETKEAMCEHISNECWQSYLALLTENDNFTL